MLRTGGGARSQRSVNITAVTKGCLFTRLGAVTGRQEVLHCGPTEVTSSRAPPWRSGGQRVPGSLRDDANVLELMVMITELSRTPNTLKVRAVPSKG